MRSDRVITSMASLGALAAVRCSSPADSTRPVSVRDSAAVAIIEISEAAPGRAEAWSLSPAPGVSIGSNDGPPEYQLFRVMGALRLMDGRFVVADNGSKSIRFYDANGTHLHSAGRDGEGPEEYRNIVVFGRYAPDSLVVWDGRLRRVTVLGTDGTFSRSFGVRGFGDTSVYIQTAVGDGSFLGSVDEGVIPDELAAGVHDNQTKYLRLQPTGRIDTIGEFFANEFLITNDRSLMEPPFARSGVWAAAPGELHYSSNDSHELRKYAMDGQLTRILRIARSNQRLTQPEVEAFTQTELAKARDPESMRRRREFLTTAPFPEVLPAFSVLQVDAVGNLWAAAYRLTSDEPSRWTIFAAEGNVVATITTPSNLRVTDLGSDYILGVERAELDVERVVLYSIVKGSGPRPARAAH